MTWRDHFLPPSLPPVGTRRARREGIELERAELRPEDMARLAGQLAGPGSAALRGLGPERLLAAWEGVVERFRDPASAERHALDPPLAVFARLSPAGLAAGLEAVLGGAVGDPARRVLAAAAAHEPGFELIVLPSNLPALAVQPLWRALARGRAALLKSSSAEPLFAPAFTAALARREPRLADAVAAVTWRGGDAGLEAPLLAAARQVVAYGEAAAIADLDRRAPDKVVAHGPKTSLAIVAAGADLRAAAAGLARDVALFDQRGCLSVQAVFTTGDGAALADELARALAERARAWPPGAAGVGRDRGGPAAPRRGRAARPAPAVAAGERGYGDRRDGEDLPSVPGAARRARPSARRLERARRDPGTLVRLAPGRRGRRRPARGGRGAPAPAGSVANRARRRAAARRRRLGRRQRRRRCADGGHGGPPLRRIPAVAAAVYSHGAPNR